MIMRDIDEKYKTETERMAAYNALPQALGRHSVFRILYRFGQQHAGGESAMGTDIKAAATITIWTIIKKRLCLASFVRNQTR